MRILNLLKVIASTVITGLMLTANTYAADLEVTMDVVKQSDAGDLTGSITREIYLPKADMEMTKKHSGRYWKGGNRTPVDENDSQMYGHQMHDQMKGSMGDRRQAWDDMKDTMDDSYQAKDDMNDAMEESCQAKDDMNNAMEESYQAKDDMNDAMDDNYQVKDDMNDGYSRYRPNQGGRF
jgi:hypothetical protein